MCNIAGYVGERAAAPILLEMLRRQQDYDGGVCTGIATIHEGRIYYRKIVGDVDALIKHTDALYLPGNIGIAHTRPGGKNDSYCLSHPFVTLDETMAGVTNGTGRGSVPGATQNAIDRLEAAGYKFRGETFKDNGMKKEAPVSVAPNAEEQRVPTARNMPHLANGAITSGAEVRVNLVHMYHKAGLSIPAAMAKTDVDLYKDGVLELISTETPDTIYVLRTTRPAATLKTEDGMYIATTRFAFPDGIRGEYKQLPVMYPCKITKDGITVTEDKMTGCDEIAEVTDYTLEEGYKRICDLLRGKQDAPLYFDDLEFAVTRDMRDIFEGDHTLVQDARVVYDVLWRLTEEGKLKTERRWFKNEKFRTFMWI